MTDKQRYRLRFCKRDRLRFISHHDLMQTFERALRRAGFRVAHTQGYNPRPKLTFALALPLGVESLDEVVDIELEQPPPADDVLNALKTQLPEGLEPTACTLVDARDKARVDVCRFEVDLSQEDTGKAHEAINKFHQPGPIPVVREAGEKRRETDLKACVKSLNVSGARLGFELAYPDGGAIKPAELLAWIGIDPLAVKIVKTQTVLVQA